MRTEKELIKRIRNTSAEYGGLYITTDELNIIQESVFVNTCEYVGLRDGHRGLDTYHVTLIDDNGLKSLYIIED